MPGPRRCAIFRLVLKALSAPHALSGRLLLSTADGLARLHHPAEGSLKPDAIMILLACELLLHILVSLQHLFMFSIPHPHHLFDKVILLLAESMHLVLLLLDQLCLSGDHLLLPHLDMSLLFLLIELVGLELDLMRIRVLSLLG